MSSTAAVATTSSQPIRKLPGLLRILPDSLPFYPYCQTDNLPSRKHSSSRKQKIMYDEECRGNTPLYADDNAISKPLHNNTSTIPTRGSFTLFFFVDYTNRQSLGALPAVSSWFQHSFPTSTNDGTYGFLSNDITENRVICIPNHPLPFEIEFHEPSSDSVIQANIDTSSTTMTVTETQSSQKMLHPMLINTGFYHLPFHHPKRLALLRLLNATRVPSIIVVDNCSGRIVTQYGWEAVEREYSGKLKKWTDGNNGYVGRQFSQNSMYDDECGDKEGCFSACQYFHSQVVEDWRMGKSGLPFHWYLLSWIL
jgi:hypothetical protein